MVMAAATIVMSVRANVRANVRVHYSEDVNKFRCHILTNLSLVTYYVCISFKTGVFVIKVI